MMSSWATVIVKASIAIEGDFLAPQAKSRDPDSHGSVRTLRIPRWANLFKRSGTGPLPRQLRVQVSAVRVAQANYLHYAPSGLLGHLLPCGEL